LKTVLAAVAAAWALDVALHVMRTGAETFSIDPIDNTESNTMAPISVSLTFNP
jgi:hypothetical protein